MNDTQIRFLDLANQYENLEKHLGEVREQLTAVMKDLGVDTYLQDPATGLVFKIIEPTGIFTYYKKIDYKRTAKSDERQGSLSKKEASEKGFIVG